MARRSLPRLMISDNGTYFKSTGKFLMALFENPLSKIFWGIIALNADLCLPELLGKGGFMNV